MRSLGGLVLLAGIGVGLFVYLPAPVDRSTSLDNVRRVAAATTVAKPRPDRLQVQDGLRSFAPGISLTSLAPRDATSATRQEPASGWQTTALSVGDTQTRSLEPTSPESRYRLVVDLQEQLKRVGCYYGRIDGSWGAGSKYAMQSFMQRVNATLPSTEPDYVMLNLLKSQSGKVCGTCPDDQTLSPGGRCVANATVAYGQRSDEPMAAAAPKEVLPWQSATTTAAQPATQPLFTPLPTSVVSTEPLPGRMAIGGPTALPPVNSVYAPQSSPAGNGPSSLATAAAVGPDAGAPPAIAAPATPKPTKTYKKARRRDGPGTPRYNLMLSLGGVY